MQKITNNPSETREVINSIAAKLHGGDLLCLRGDLGSGKTTSTACLAEYFGIKENITSPTFVIMKLYELPQEISGIKRFLHMDAYRLHGAPDAESVGLSEFLSDKNALIILEWPENIENVIPKERKTIYFKHLGGDRRQINTDF